MSPCLAVLLLMIFTIKEPGLSSFAVLFSSSCKSSWYVMAVLLCCAQYLDAFAGVFWHPVLMNNITITEKHKTTCNYCVNWMDCCHLSLRAVEIFHLNPDKWFSLDITSLYWTFILLCTLAYCKLPYTWKFMIRNCVT